VRKRVTNISSHLPEPMDVEIFINRLMSRVAGVSSLQGLGLRAEETAGIRGLAEKKYATWEWNYGASPKYDFSLATRTPGGLVEVHLNAARGLIEDIKIYGDFFGSLPIDELAECLIGCEHAPDAVLARLQDLAVERYIHGIDAAVLTRCLF
jgi:lipoate-protein ligase A